MSTSKQSKAKAAAKTSTATKVEKPVIEKTNEVTANNRGYAYLKNLKNAPDFAKLKKGDFNYSDDKKSMSINCNKDTQDVGNMLRRGYLHIGANRKATITFPNNTIKVA